MKTLMMTAAALASIVINVANAAPLPEAKPDDVGFSQPGLARLDDFFAREIAAKRVPGAVVAIARDGKLVDRKSTRLNSSHVKISYAVFCLKKKKKIEKHNETV